MIDMKIIFLEIFTNDEKVNIGEIKFLINCKMFTKEYKMVPFKSWIDKNNKMCNK